MLDTSSKVTAIGWTNGIHRAFSLGLMKLNLEL